MTTAIKNIVIAVFVGCMIGIAGTLTFFRDFKRSDFVTGDSAWNEAEKLVVNMSNGPLIATNRGERWIVFDSSLEKVKKVALDCRSGLICFDVSTKDVKISHHGDGLTFHERPFVPPNDAMKDLLPQEPFWGLINDRYYVLELERDALDGSPGSLRVAFFPTNEDESHGMAVACYTSN